MDAALWGRSAGVALYDGCRRDVLRAMGGEAVEAADIAYSSAKGADCESQVGRLYRRS